jgi:thiol-disulfide isomerase/thioredoxin
VNLTNRRNQRTRCAAASLMAAVIGVGVWLALEPMGLGMAPSVGYTLLDGTRANTGELRGKVILVNFWATSCEPCIREMPQVIATDEKYRQRGLETLAVSMSYDPPAAVINYAQTRRLPFAVVIDNTGEIAKSFGRIEATPTTLLINKRGEIVKRYVGEPDFAAVRQLVEKLLAQA